MPSPYYIHTPEEWYQQPLGNTVLKTEQDKLQQQLSSLQGYFLLQCDGDISGNWIELSHASKKFILQFNSSIKHKGISLQSEAINQPFKDESFDIVLLPHTLEIYPGAKHILHEAWRLVAPSGHLVILGFNPWSWFGLHHLLQQNFLPKHYFHRLHSAAKIRYWLESLNANIINLQHFFYRPLLNNENSLAKLIHFEKIMPYLAPNTGSSYIICAQKLIPPLTPMRTRWSLQEIFADKPIPETNLGRFTRG